MPERPLQYISDEQIEERWKMCQEIADDPIFPRALRECVSLIAADLSLERNARLAQRWEPAAEEDDPRKEDPRWLRDLKKRTAAPDELYYDDRWHAMRRD